MALWCTVALVDYVLIQKLGSKSHQSLQSTFYFCLAISFYCTSQCFFTHLHHCLLVAVPALCVQMVFENKKALLKSFWTVGKCCSGLYFFFSLSVLIKLDLSSYQVCQMLFHGLMYLVL